MATPFYDDGRETRSAEEQAEDWESHPDTRAAHANLERRATVDTDSIKQFAYTDRAGRLVALIAYDYDETFGWRLLELHEC